MLKPITTSFILFILIAFNTAFGQNDTIPSRVNQVLEFAIQHEIDTTNFKKCQILTDIDLRKGPAKDAEISGIRIAKGEIVKALKIFPNTGTWAIIYKGNPGFVPIAALMTVKEEEQPSMYSPYDEAPVLVSRIQAEYPPEAQKQRIEGEVVMYVLVNKKGFVDEVKISKGIPELNQAAVEAVEDLKFKPGKLEGKPVEVWVRIPIKFNYSDL